jgi:ABC-2 type transport system permease protein
MSVLTDVPLGAVGTAVVLVIVLNILDAIEALGGLRELLPTHYATAWVDALNPVVTWNQMATGAAYNTFVFAVFIGLAFILFDRKDIVS